MEQQEQPLDCWRNWCRWIWGVRRGPDTFHRRWDTQRDFNIYFWITISNCFLPFHPHWGISNNLLLVGTIPFTFGNLTQLTVLDVPGNQLTGPISSSIGKLTQLMELLLWSNRLTGSILATLRNLTQLTFLGLMENQLTGTIPLSFRNLKQL